MKDKLWIVIADLLVVFVGLVLIYSGIEHLLNPFAFLQDVQNYRLLPFVASYWVAFFNGSDIEFAVMDGDITASGSQGLRATMSITSFSGMPSSVAASAKNRPGTPLSASVLEMSVVVLACGILAQLQTH